MEKGSHLKNLLPLPSELYYFETVFSGEECQYYFNTLVAEIKWKQEPITIFGKLRMQPRLTAWYAEDALSYRYSGIRMQGLPWTRGLIEIKNRVEAITGTTFNSALLNYYRHQQDSMGWHRDNEKELGAQPNIASVSFGASRPFKLRTYQEKSNLKIYQLENGSVLLMKGDTQQLWEHSLPKLSSLVDARINLTFRTIQKL